MTNEHSGFITNIGSPDFIPTISHNAAMSSETPHISNISNFNSTFTQEQHYKIAERAVCALIDSDIRIREMSFRSNLDEHKAIVQNNMALERISYRERAQEDRYTRKLLGCETIIADQEGYLRLKLDTTLIYDDAPIAYRSDPGKRYYSAAIISARGLTMTAYRSCTMNVDYTVFKITSDFDNELCIVIPEEKFTASVLGRQLAKNGIRIYLAHNRRTEILDLLWEYLYANCKVEEIPAFWGWNLTNEGNWVFAENGKYLFGGNCFE